MSLGTSVADAEGNAMSRTRPARRPRISASSPAAASIAVATAFAWRASTRPDCGEADAATDTLDERDAGALLEPPQLLAHRGLAVPERLGRGGERAVLGDLAHDAHGLQVECGREAFDGGIGHARNHNRTAWM